ncbi:MAG: amidohydrolase family protein [Acidobacteria bacterium]|nr:amidohydrolase family protein [Acidobacteriota bacterium]
MICSRARILVLVAANLIAGATVVAQQDLPPEILVYPDLILHNGKVMTVDEKFSVAQAVAVLGGKIQAVGMNDRILKMAGPATKQLDLQGKSIIPGLVEVHTGFFLTQGPGSPSGFPGATVDFTTMEGGLEGIRKAAASKKPGEWVHIYCPNNSNIAKLTLETLDQVVPNNPLLMSPHSSNKSIINSQTLRLLPDSIRTTPGYMTDPSGKFTGWLIGHASGVVRYEVVPWLDLDELAPKQEQLLRFAASWGLTTIGGRFNGMSLSLVRKLQQTGRLPLRVRAVLELQMNPNAVGLLKRVGNLTELGDEWFRISGGTVVPPDSNEKYGSAYTLKPKLGHVARDTYGDYGMFAWAEITGSYDPAVWKQREEWWKKNSDYNTIIEAGKMGWNITEIHAKGDGAYEALMQAYEEIDKINPTKGRRFGSVHGQMRNSDQIDRSAKLGLFQSVGMHYLFIRDPVELKLQYGPDGVHRMSPIKSLIDKGIKVTFEHPNGFDKVPSAYMMLIEKSVTRENESTGQIWGRDEKITREQALRMATIWPAEYHKSEREVGSIETGKLADMVILGGDFMTVPEQDISKIPILATIVGGKVAYDRDGLLGLKVIPTAVALEGE